MSVPKASTILFAYTFPIPGTKQKKRLLENLGALDVKLSEAELAEIASAVPAGAVKGTRYPEAQMASLYI